MNPGSRRPRAILAAGILLFLSGAALGDAEDLFSALQVERPRVRVAAPAFTLPTLAGDTMSLADQQGKVILLNFWATWCRPCREEMPSLQRLWEEFRTQPFVILAVAADRGSKKTVADFVAGLGLDFPVLLDTDGSVRRHYEVYGLPMSYLIGKDGRISGRIPAAQDWHSEAARALIRHLLKQP
ncbi:MAG: TlpA disulfide reductase family protein [Gammaproteobacteria bacterium]